MINTKFMLYLLTGSILLINSPAFAGHDHGGGNNSGSHDSSGHSSTPSQADQQAANTAGQHLNNCTQHIDSIQRHIYRLQAKIAEKRGVSSINNELEAFEQKLNLISTDLPLTAAKPQDVCLS
ncbi:MAG: hypothetical protein M0023_03840 [Desulfobacteraceae bacterium]|nr:hypothetical protein [Desulfobacteraceae bacterium]